MEYEGGAFMSDTYVAWKWRNDFPHLSLNVNICPWCLTDGLVRIFRDPQKVVKWPVREGDNIT